MEDQEAAIQMSGESLQYSSSGPPMDFLSAPILRTMECGWAPGTLSVEVGYHCGVVRPHHVVLPVQLWGEAVQHLLYCCVDVAGGVWPRASHAILVTRSPKWPGESALSR